METATSQVIGQLSGYMRGLTQRLDPGAGWYGEFLRRDPQGMRACLDGAAMPPWDVLESLLGDLAASTGATALARETQYAAGLRAAAVGVWDRLPGGVEELRTLLASTAEQRARAREGLRVLSARLTETADPTQARALSRELSWTRDDAARAAARHDDLTARLEAVAPGTAVRPEDDWPGHPAQARPEPLNAVPAQRAAMSPGGVPAGAWPGPREGGVRGDTGPRDAEWAGPPADARDAASGAAWSVGPGSAQGAASSAGPGRLSGEASGVGPGWAQGVASSVEPGWLSGEASDVASRRVPGAASAPAAGPAAGPASTVAGEPVGRAEGRWLRGARRSGGARYAGAAEPEAAAVTVPPGQPSSTPPLRGARFGRPARAAAEPASTGEPGSGHAAPAGGASHEPARAGAEGPHSGQPSAGAAEGGPVGPHGMSGGSAPAGSPHGAPAQWQDPGSTIGPHGMSGGSARGRNAQGDPAQWHASAAGAAGAAGPHGMSGGSAPDGSPDGSPHGASSPRDGAFRGFVEGLVALRSQGRSGEAHVLLCEAAAGPAEQLVRLGEELGRAGLAADWATLLWEAASLPPARFAAAAAVLGPADREALLRQGAARPAAEIAEAALVLAEAGHTPEADALLAAFVRVRTAEESARLARRDPHWFVPRLLRAAEALSGAQHRDLLHALRVANLPVA
ncbi:hypothetical protein ACIQV3_34410 [Streptomyces sp. NPDC099050]|uniref:hypothetical protein n=1 Tax=Streptomyces sp. NPDC099050 TaxID=3366100 RepID=UPI00380EB9B6